MEPEKFSEMVEKVRRVELMLGEEKKIVTKDEKEMQKSSRRGIKSTMKIKKGTVITKDMIAILRPQTGLPPEELSKILGKKASVNIGEFVPIEKNML
jgi:sialic acid synthase SpsE